MLIFTLLLIVLASSCNFRPWAIKDQSGKSMSILDTNFFYEKYGGIRPFAFEADTMEQRFGINFGYTAFAFHIPPLEKDVPIPSVYLSNQ